MLVFHFFFFQAEVGIRDRTVTGIQTCALPIFIVDLSHGVPPVATIIACALERSIGPCTRSTMIQSRPERAMICKIGRASCRERVEMEDGEGACEAKADESRGV